MKKLFAFIAFIFGIILYSFFENSFFKLKKESYRPNYQIKKPIKILHISDIHLLANQKKKIAFLKSLAKEEIDLIVNTGDNIAQNESIEILAEIFNKFKDVPGVFVYGSNDYFEYLNVLEYIKTIFKENNAVKRIKAEKPDRLNTERLTEVFTGLGWHCLNNESKTINIHGSDIDFIGFNDPHIRLDKPVKIAKKTNNLRIGVVHAPYKRVLKRMKKANVNLCFAGHTHGGQIRLPVIGSVVNNTDIKPQISSGLTEYNGVRLYISNGVGGSPKFPFRFLNRPSATIIELN